MRTPIRLSKLGFTFVEVMCVMIIISIVSSIALPAIGNFHSADRCKAEASVLVSYIRQAKYQAMQENSLNRIIFLKDGDYGTAFKVQKYDPDEESSKTFDNIITTSEPQTNKYDSEDWKSIVDEEEIEFNSSVEVDLSQLVNLTTIYFKPDGFIYHLPVTKNQTATTTTRVKPIKIPEYSIYFKYGSSAVAVDINALGVISSEAIPNEDDDEYFDDKHNEAEDDERTYD